MELQKKIDQAIALLQSIPTDDGPIELSYSGGKDSDVILELSKMAGIPFEPIYKNTTIDPPGTLQHCRENGVIIVQPKENFLQLIERMGWPSRWARFCCGVLKEYKIHNRAILGIRREESTKRAKLYVEPEACRFYSKKECVQQYYPILEWTNMDVLNFVKDRKIKLHPHYFNERGVLDIKRRVGCIGCPLGEHSQIDGFKAYPTIFRARVKAFIRWWNNHPNSHTVKTFPSPYHALYMKLFCHDMQEYQTTWQGGFFDVGTDAKTFLERYFGIDLTI